MLNALDLLTLSDIEQDIRRTLSRTPRQDLAQLTANLSQSDQDVAAAVTKMVHSAQLVEQLQDDRRVFSVRMRLQNGRVRNLPAAVTQWMERPTPTFLKDAPLTKSLSPTLLDHMAACSTWRDLLPDEVLAWQGQSFPHVAVLRDGLVSEVHLQEGAYNKVHGYVRQGHWLGLTGIFHQAPSRATYKAITASRLLIWPRDVFLEMLGAHAEMGWGLSQYLDQQLLDVTTADPTKTARLWAIEPLEEGAGASTLAAYLAKTAVHNNTQQPAKVVVWNLSQHAASNTLYDFDPAAGTEVEDGTLWRTTSGVDLFAAETQVNYPLEVYLDIVLNRLLSHYDYVIGDLGLGTAPLAGPLRRQADLLMTITAETNAAAHFSERWRSLRQEAPPTQKRLAILNKCRPTTGVDPFFNAALPFDAQLDAPGGSAMSATLAQATATIFERISLEHTIAIFVPSTIDVDAVVDNQQQVQATLNFLGDRFGGATSAPADGVWKSAESGLVAEIVTIVRTFVSKSALDSNLDEVVQYATALKKRMKQEAVAIDIDNQLILV